MTSSGAGPLPAETVQQIALEGLEPGLSGSKRADRPRNHTTAMKHSRKRNKLNSYADQVMFLLYIHQLIV